MTLRVIGFVVVIAGCGSDGSGGGSNAGESTSSTGTTSETSTASTSSGGGSATGQTNDSGIATSVGGTAPATGFDHCGDSAPTSACSVEGTCLEASCGHLFSELDEDGCVRAPCIADSDCDEDSLCFPGPIVYQSDAMFPRFGLQCSEEGTRCSCVGRDVRDGAAAYCAPRTLVLGDWGCTPSPELTGNCMVLSDWIAAAEALLTGLTLYQTVGTRVQTCITQAQENFTQNCAD